MQKNITLIRKLQDDLKALSIKTGYAHIIPSTPEVTVVTTALLFQHQKSLEISFTNLTAPDGAMPTNPLYVTWCW